MKTNPNMKVNRSVFAIAHTEKKAVVIVGQDDQTMLAFTPEAARLLGNELQRIADLAEGDPNAQPADLTATNVKTGSMPVLTPGKNGNEYVN
jgi:hypothetical protein